MKGKTPLNDEDAFWLMQDLDLESAGLPFNMRQKLIKIEHGKLFPALITSTLMGKVISFRNKNTGDLNIKFSDSEDNEYIIDKYFIDENFSEFSQVLLDDLKKKTQSDEELSKTVSLTYSLLNVFTQKFFDETVVRKQSDEYFRWLSKYVNTDKSQNRKFKSVFEYFVAHRVLYDYEHKDEETENSEKCDNTNLIKSLLKHKIVDAPLMHGSGYFTRFKVRDVIEMYEQDILDGSDILEILGEDGYKQAVMGIEDSLNYWYDQKEESLYHNPKEIQKNIRAYEKKLSSLASIPKGIPLIVDLYLSGDIDESTFGKVFDKVHVNKLSGEQIVGLMKTKFTEKMQLSSKQLLGMYGTTLSGRECIELASIGRINPEELINLSKYNSIKISSPKLAVSPDELINFYSPEVLLEMYKDNKLSPDFIKKYKDLLEENLDEIDLEIKYSEIVSRVHDLEKDTSEEIIIDLFKKGLLPAESLKGFVSTQLIDDMFLDENLSMSEILSLVKSGVIRMEDTDKYFTSEEIIESIVSGELSEEFIGAMDPSFVAPKLKELYLSGKCPLELFMKAYLDHGVIEIGTLNEAFEENKPQVDLLQFISKQSDVEKIKELFTSYHISYEDLFTLLHNEIIDEDTFNDIKTTIDKAEFYKKLSQTKRITVDTSEKPEKRDVPIVPPVFPSEKKSKIDFELERKAFEELYDTPSFARDNIPVIESYNTVTGKPTSLNKYIIIPIEKYGLVAFEKFAPGNSLFLMPYQQADFFLHGNMSMLDVSEQDLSDSGNRDKKTLYEMESVHVISHSKNFWKHVIDSSTELSEEARQDLKPRGRYSATSKKYMEQMKTRYEENAKSMDD